MKKYFPLMLTVLLFGVLQTFGQKNMLLNGGFEDGLNQWSYGNAKVSTYMRKSGEASLALVSFVKGKWEGVDQKVKLSKNTKAILISGYYKCNGIEAGSNSWNTATIIVEFANGDKKTGEGIPLIQKTGTEDWTSFTKRLKVPDQANSFRLIIALSEASGTFLVDDLEAKTIAPEDVDQGKNP